MIILFQPFNFLIFFTKGGGIWAHMKDLANHKAEDTNGLKLELLKWVANDLCEPITKLFSLVPKEGFPASWTININQMNIKYCEIHSRGIVGP